jgi:hypothetical protein
MMSLQLAVNIYINYYWNPLQGLISGSKGFIEIGTKSNPWGYAIVFVLMFIPVMVVAFLSTKPEKNFKIRLLLLIPALTFLISAIIRLQQTMPFSESFKDIYSGFDNVIYIPFSLHLALTAGYLVLAVMMPESIVTKVAAVITIVVSIIFFIGDAGYHVYIYIMDILGGDFGIIRFGILMGAFALNVITYFLMLSIIMNYCAMYREPIIDRRLAERKHNKEKVTRNTVRFKSKKAGNDTQETEGNADKATQNS